MALFFFITLCISIVAIFLLLIVKRFEMRTGKVFFMRVRPALHRGTHGAIFLAQYFIPYLMRRGATSIWSRMRAGISRTFALVTLYVEHTLHQALHGVEKMVEPRRAQGQVSAFLQEVADHKQKLLRKPAQKRAIFERY